MKKLLTILGSIGLVASTGANAVESCGTPKNDYKIFDLGQITIPSANIYENNKAYGMFLHGEIISQSVQDKEAQLYILNNFPEDINKVSDEVWEFNDVGTLEMLDLYDFSKLTSVKETYFGEDGNPHYIGYTFKFVK